MKLAINVDVDVVTSILTSFLSILSASTVGLRHRTRPSKREIYLWQASKIAGQPPKWECRLHYASGQLLSNTQQSAASPTH